MSRRYAWGLVAFVLGACSPKTPDHVDDVTAPPPTRTVKPVQSAVPLASASATAPAPAPGSTTSATSKVEPPVTPEGTPPATPKAAPSDPGSSGPPFPPPSFVPPHTRTAAPGDGVFTLIEEGAAAGTGALARTMVHPLPYRKDAFVVVIAVDLRRVDLVSMAGTEEPVSTTVPKERRPGLVPSAEQTSLIAVFNGGFLSKHGQFGMRVNGDDFAPALDDSCSVAFLDDGSLRIATHRALAPIVSRVRSYRQTPPCLVEGGTSDARLVHEDTARLWGAALGGKREIRRTALGLDATGRTLFFGIGDWIWARDIALAMKVAGAVDVAELDINWSYTRFLLYDRSTPPNVVSTTSIPKAEYTKDGYITKPASRDFFYLRRKMQPRAPGAP